MKFSNIFNDLIKRQADLKKQPKTLNKKLLHLTKQNLLESFIWYNSLRERSDYLIGKEEKRFHLFKQLLKWGADPNLKNTKGTPILISTIQKGNSPQFIEELLKAGADPNIKNKKGETALIALLRNKKMYQKIQDQLRLDADDAIRAEKTYAYSDLIKAADIKRINTIAEKLLKFGADPNSVDPKSKKTAHEITGLFLDPTIKNMIDHKIIKDQKKQEIERIKRLKGNNGFII